MSNARSDIALALLLIGQMYPTIQKRARHFFEQEQRNAFKNNNWHEKLKILLYCAFLANTDRWKKEMMDFITPHLSDVYEEMMCSPIHENMKGHQLAGTLFHFMVPPLCGIKTEEEGISKLLRIGRYIHKKITEREVFVSESLTKLCQLYFIVSKLNGCDEAIYNITEDVKVLYSTCRLKLNLSMSILFDIKTSIVSDFTFRNILTMREMTDIVLGELLCEKNHFTTFFLSEGFLSEEYLSNVIPIDNRRFSLNGGFARLLLTYVLAIKRTEYNNIKKMAMVLLSL